jgi:4-alpha-glucanotransferase
VRSCGVLTEYTDVFKRRVRPKREALLAVLGVLLGMPDGSERELADAARARAVASGGGEPVVVAWDGRLPANTTGRVVLEEGREASSGEALPSGYHLLHAGGRETLVISAPSRCFERTGERGWGVFLPLYSLRSARNWGIGDLTDLGALIEWTHRLGGDVVGTLPLLAAFLDRPFDPSPYAPASRLFWNELYVDVERAPELERSPGARGIVESSEFRRLVDRAREGQHVDHGLVFSLKRRVLEMLAREWDGDPPPDELLGEYAVFRAGPDADGARYHAYVQQLMERQLSETAGDARLFLDLPLGVHPEGFDTWRFPESFARGVSGGAPPDPFFTAGQDWGFPPLHPGRIREDRYRYPIACFRHLMRHASVVRIDHVMWTRRMFWVPDGMSARDGVYVRYPEEELYAILSLESHRNRTTVVGEDLGTVPKGVRTQMRRHRVHRTFVLQYELRTPPLRVIGAVPEASQASLNTHDMPTFAATWEGLDTALREELGLLDEHGAGDDREERERLRAALVAFLRSEGWLARDVEPTAHEVMRACQRYLAASPARTVIVNLEDLWDEREPQNMPGTGAERPNWVRKAAVAFEAFRDDPEVLGTLQEVASLRRGLDGEQIDDRA